MKPIRIVAVEQDIFDSTLIELKQALLVSSKIHREDRTYRTSEVERHIERAIAYLERGESTS